MRIALLAFIFSVLAAYPVLADSLSAKVMPEMKFVQKLGDKALMSLTSKSLSSKERKNRTRNLLRARFDIKTIGRFVLGKNWRKATEVERAEYLKLFEAMIVTTYAVRFEHYSGQEFIVDGFRKLGGNDSIVKSRILQDGGPPVAIEWRVRKKNDSMKVIDVIVENISMSVTQRSDFDAVIQRNGGKIEGLLKSMRSRNVTATASK